MKKSNNHIGFIDLLQLAFIILKLTGYIDWSWWWVLSPIWILTIVIFIIVIYEEFCGED